MGETKHLKMKVIAVLLLGTLALTAADQSKMWNMFKKMMTKVAGAGGKEELQELMQLKETIIKDIKEKDTIGLLGKVSTFDRDVHMTCTFGTLGLLKGGVLNKDKILGMAKLTVKNEKMLEEVENNIRKCFKQTLSCNTEDSNLQEEVVVFMQCMKPNMIHTCFKDRIRSLVMKKSENDIAQFMGDEF